MSTKEIYNLVYDVFCEAGFFFDENELWEYCENLSDSEVEDF